MARVLRVVNKIFVNSGNSKEHTVVNVKDERLEKLSKEEINFLQSVKDRFRETNGSYKFASAEIDLVKSLVNKSLLYYSMDYDSVAPYRLT